MRRVSSLVVVLAVVFVTGAVLRSVPRVAFGSGSWTRPVPGRVVRPFVAPRTRFGRGHEGVDFAAAPGSAVRAAGTGRVVFAGLVAGALHVVVRHPGDLRTSYSFLASLSVHSGDPVARGTVVGTSGGTGEHHASDVLHFGLRIGDTFVDPMQLFGPVDLSVRVHLAPLTSTGAARPASRLPGEAEALLAGLAEAPAPAPRRPVPEPSVGVPICDHWTFSAGAPEVETPPRPG